MIHAESMTVCWFFGFQMPNQTKSHHTKFHIFLIIVFYPMLCDSANEVKRFLWLELDKACIHNTLLVRPAPQEGCQRYGPRAGSSLFSHIIQLLVLGPTHNRSNAHFGWSGVGAACCASPGVSVACSIVSDWAEQALDPACEDGAGAPWILYMPDPAPSLFSSGLCHSQHPL